MYKKISDYGVIGNLCTVALIGPDGSIDWLCLPYLDSPSIFGALLDDRKGGRFALSPTGDWDSTQEYLPDTNILVTRFRTRTGVVRLTDFMPAASNNGLSREKAPELYRLVEVERGTVELRLVFEPRFNYARAEISVETGPCSILAQSDREAVTLSFSREGSEPLIKGESVEARWRLGSGGMVRFHLSYGRGELCELDPEQAHRAFEETAAFWRNWLKISETGRSVAFGPYREMAVRSALVLKLLSFQPSGTIAAAATTSLPEAIGGQRNWDYRFSWVRDNSLTLQALFNLGHLSEMHAYLNWLKKLIMTSGAENLQIMYGLRGEVDIPEAELNHLDGYKGSRPVRIGNAAAGQRQLDIYGDLLDAALNLSNYLGKIDPPLWASLARICDYVVQHWQEKDQGIWEVRSGPQDFVYSKVMCWVALDRGATIARRYGFPGNIQEWRETKDRIKEEVLTRGWSPVKGAFRQHYATDALDASALRLPLVGFLPFEDQRIVSTIEAINHELGPGGFLKRYTLEDGLPGDEGTFLFCSFWMVDCLIGLNLLEDAEALLHRLEGAANHLGLFSEEYDLDWRESLGNFPQAFTHIGYVNSVVALQQAKTVRAARRQKHKETPTPWYVFKKILLNDGDPSEDIPPQEMAARLKSTMNVLRGAFFEAGTGRVAYEKMQQSEIFQTYLRLSNDLKNMDLAALASREEKIAFWINLYNVIVIHGVIALGIRDSVKEVWNFFRRVCYQIGDHLFNPEDIEHGILRGNRRPPYSLLKRFRAGDPRLAFIVEPLDSRIHFALVCGSSSCPFIDVYTPENLEEELTMASQTFVNSGGAVLERSRNQISLSRVFKWYATDFGATQAERLRFITPYFFNAQDRSFVEDHADSLKVSYQSYDWRLNRY
jgi:GH15 family glucan-1,4-alpha-glucosidase